MTGEPCARAPLPSAHGLTWDQGAGIACIICARPLTTGAVSRGRIHGRAGAHHLDIDAWACPLPEQA
ncbi:hypothetical protein [Streptomyces subrutilus]|uniref:hypothetical protein n=1 Tax=Streptomyces subrutilus TaxID=36818 RepID=UPI0016773FB6|nr:hypothetical protein [Streptomyces subrutilus]